MLRAVTVIITHLACTPPRKSLFLRGLGRSVAAISIRFTTAWPGSGRAMSRRLRCWAAGAG